MKVSDLRRAPFWVALCLAVALLAGCSKTPEEEYDEAVAELNQVQQSRQETQKRIQNLEQQIQELRADLNEAQANLEQDREKIRTAREKVQEVATDEVLFRKLQQDVLNKDIFDNAAISVGVQNRIVTLTGHVPSDKAHQRALELARSQPGVRNVVDELEVRDGATSAPSQSAQASGAGSDSQAGGSNSGSGNGSDNGGQSSGQSGSGQNSGQDSSQNGGSGQGSNQGSDQDNNQGSNGSRSPAGDSGTSGAT